MNAKRAFREQIRGEKGKSGNLWRREGSHLSGTVSFFSGRERGGV